MEIIRYTPYPGIESEETLSEQRKYLDEQTAKVMQGRKIEVDYLFSGSSGEKEFMWVGNSLYKRDLDFGNIYEKEELFTKISHDDSPDIICECGNEKFRLYYGSYSIRAVCPKCGKEQIVYDG